MYDSSERVRINAFFWVWFQMHRFPTCSPGTTRVSLLHRLRRNPGDPEAWANFVQLYEPQVVSWCQAQGLQEADAADVAQEALVRFWKKACSFEYSPGKRFRSYLRLLTLQTLSDWVERTEREPIGTGNSGIKKLLDGLPARAELMARLNEMFDQENLERALILVRKRVEPRTWEAFRLLAIDGLTGKQAAEQLQMKLSTVIAARCVVQKMVKETVQRFEPDAI